MSDEPWVIEGYLERYAEPRVIVAPLRDACRVSRFWLSVAVRRLTDGSPDIDTCWLWTGYVEQGYGRFYDGARMRPAHEMALTYFSGEERSIGLDTCHNCNTPLCCNPHHLRFDTRASNVADMLAAGTHNPKRKLSDNDVRVIRERAEAGASGKTLAATYGVSQGLITEIIRGNRRLGAGGPIRTTHGNIRRSTHAR